MPVLEGIEKYILQDKFNFKPNCLLKSFLEKYTGIGNQSFKLMDVHRMLHVTLRAQNMFDDNNQSIIICTPELEHVLNIKAVHTLDLLSKIQGVPKKTGISGNRTYIQFVWHKCKKTSVITFKIDCSEWKYVVYFKRH